MALNKSSLYMLLAVACLFLFLSGCTSSAQSEQIDEEPELGPKGQIMMLPSARVGYTSIKMRNIGPGGDAIVSLTWQNRKGLPRISWLIIAQRNEAVVYLGLFAGAEVKLTNHSKNSVISVLNSLD